MAAILVHGKVRCCGRESIIGYEPATPSMAWSTSTGPLPVGATPDASMLPTTAQEISLAQPAMDYIPTISEKRRWPTRYPFAGSLRDRNRTPQSIGPKAHLIRFEWSDGRS